MWGQGCLLEWLKGCSTREPSAGTKSYEKGLLPLFSALTGSSGRATTAERQIASRKTKPNERVFSADGPKKPVTTTPVGVLTSDFGTVHPKLKNERGDKEVNARKDYTTMGR